MPTAQQVRGVGVAAAQAGEAELGAATVARHGLATLGHKQDST